MIRKLSLLSFKILPEGILVLRELVKEVHVSEIIRFFHNLDEKKSVC